MVKPALAHRPLPARGGGGARNPRIRAGRGGPDGRTGEVPAFLEREMGSDLEPMQAQWLDSRLDQTLDSKLDGKLDQLDDRNLDSSLDQKMDGTLEARRGGGATAMEALAGSYRGKTAVPASLARKPLSVQRHEPADQAPEPGKDRPIAKPREAPADPAAKPDGGKPSEAKKGAGGGKKDGDKKEGSGKDKGKGEGEQGEEQEEGAGKPGDKKKASAPGPGGGGAGPTVGGADREDKLVYVPLDLPPAELGRVALYRPPLELRDDAMPFQAPAYLRHRPEQPSEALEEGLKDYAQRFAAASDGARHLYDDILARIRVLNDAARSSEDRRSDRRQAGLDQALEDLAESLYAARLLLGRSRADQLLRLRAAARTTRLALSRTAGGGTAQLEKRAKRINSDLGPARKHKDRIVGLPAAKSAEIDSAHKQAMKGLDALAADPSSRLKGRGTAERPAMRAAQEEAIIRDIAYPVAEAKVRLARSTVEMKAGVEKQAPGLDSSLCPSFCPFDGFKAVLRGEAVKAVGSAHTTSLNKLKETLETAEVNVQKTYDQAEKGLIEQHNQLRRRLVEGARQRHSGERDQARLQAQRGAGGLATLAAAQGKAVGGIDDMLGKRRKSKEEDFARIVISYSQGLLDDGIGGSRRQSDRMAESSEDSQARVDKASDTANARFGDGARQSAAQLGGAAEQSVRANGKMVDDVGENMARLVDPIRDTVSGFLNRVGGQADQAMKGLEGDLGKVEARVIAGFKGPVPKDEDKKDSVDGKGAKKGSGKGAAKGKAAAKDGKEGAPDPAVTACQAACPKDEKGKDGAGKEGEGKEGQGAKGKGAGKAEDKAGGGEQEYPDQYRDRLIGYGTDATAEKTVASYIQAMPGIVERDLCRRAANLKKTLGYLDSDPPTVLSYLRGITKKQGKAIEEAYDGNLRKDLDWYLNAGNPASGVTTRVESISAARAYLNGDPAAGAMHEMTAAIQWSNNSQQIDAALKSLTREQIESMKARFPEQLAEVRGDLNEMDGKVYDRLTSDRLGEADALRAKEKMIAARDYYGDKGADKAVDAIGDAWAERGSSRLGGAAQFAETEAGYETKAGRQKQEWADILKGFATVQGKTEQKGEEGKTMIEFAAAQPEHYVYVPDKDSPKDPNKGRWEISKTVSDAQRNLIAHMVKGDEGEGSAEARAARMAVELGRPGGPDPDRLRIATDDKELNADLVDPKTHAAALERQKKMYELVAEWAPGDKDKPGVKRSPADIQADVADRLAGALKYDPEKAKYVRALVVGNPGDPKTVIARLDYAMEGAGTNVEVLKQTLGTMSRDQFEKVREEYDKTHEPHLLARLGIRGQGNWLDSETSGDTANDLELLSMGQPRNERERAEVSALEMKQQIRAAKGSLLGDIVAKEEFDRLDHDYRKLMSVMGADDVGFDSEGKFIVKDVNGDPTTLGRFDKDGKFIPQAGFTSDDLALAMTVGQISAAAYKAKTEQIADAIATALTVTAAVVTTALTGGAAASIWIPVLVTAAAGVAGMGVKYAIKGERYGSEEMLFDLASTIIQAATAGIGAAAGTAIRGGGKAVGTLAKSWRLSEEALAKAAVGATGNAAKALPALTLGQELFVGALSAGFAGGANAAINPESFRSDHYAWDIVHGIVKGAVSGAVGAGVTRGVMGVSSLARGMGARSGAAEALAKGMSLQDAQRFAALRSELYGTSALTEVGGRALGSAASGIATRATEIGYDSLRGHKISAGQFWEEIGTVGLQNAIQAIGEGGIDRAIRSRSKSRMDEHHFTTRDDVHDYRQRATDAVVAEGIRRGLIDPAKFAGPAPGPKPAGHSTVAVDEDGQVLPLHHGGEEGGAAAPGHPDLEPTPPPPLHPVGEDGAPAVDVHPGEDEQTRLARAVDPASEIEPAAKVKTREDQPVAHSLDDEGTLLKGANDNGPEEPAMHRMEDLSKTDMVKLGRIPEGSVFVHPDITNIMAANENFYRLLMADPSREVAHLYNPITGENVIVQGGRNVVGVINAEGKLIAPGQGGMPTKWMNLLDDKGKAGHWVLRSHFHPEGGLFPSLPSGAGKDFSVLIQEMRAHGYTERSSRIYYIDNGKLQFTDFRVNLAGGADKYTISIPDPATGKHVTKPFSSMEEYHSFLTAKTNKVFDIPPGFQEETLETVPAAPKRALESGSTATRLKAGDLFQIEQVHFNVSIGSHEEAKALVKQMGLVGEPESMARLQLALNARGLATGIRQSLADTVYAATVEHMRAAGTLGPEEKLHMFFHGAPRKRTQSLNEGGIQLGQVKSGHNDDFGQALYLTYGKNGPRSNSGLENAEIYAGRDVGRGQPKLKEGERPGDVFAFFVRERDTGTVVDVSRGGAHRDAWEKFSMAHLAEIGEGRMIGTPPTIEQIMKRELPFGAFDASGNRGAVFEKFLVHLADTTGQPHLASPDIVLGELGGPFTSGYGAGEQAALRVKAASLARLMNEQIGFPKSSPAEPAAVQKGAAVSAHSLDDDEAPTQTFRRPLPSFPLEGDPTRPLPSFPLDEEPPTLRRPPVVEDEEPTLVFKRPAPEAETPGGTEPAAPIAEKSAVVPATESVEAEPETVRLPPKKPEPVPTPSGITAAHEDQALVAIIPKVEPDKKEDKQYRLAVASVFRLAQEDRPAVMAVLHAASEADAQSALRVFRDRLIAGGMGAAEVEARVKRLDYARLSIGGRFRTQVDFVAGKNVPSTAGLNPAVAGWVQQSAILQFVHGQDPTLIPQFYKSFAASKAGKAGTATVETFENSVIAKLRNKDPSLLSRVKLIDKDQAVLRQTDTSHHLFPDPKAMEERNEAMEQNNKARPASQSGPVVADPASLKRGTRVDHDPLGRGTIALDQGVPQIHFDEPGGIKVDLAQALAQGTLKTALEPDPRFDKEPPAMRDDSYVQGEIKKTKEYREARGLAPYESDSDAGTVSRLVVGGIAFYGTNSLLDPGNYTLPVASRQTLFDKLSKAAGFASRDSGRAQFLSHAEGESLIRAYLHFGALPEVVELFVDRPACPSCRKELVFLARLLGIKELRIYYGGGQDNPPLIRK